MNMDIERIRRWVRGTLPPDERREVGRWMLRSSDPSLPNIMQGLIHEHEEELADSALRLRAPGRGFLIDLWAQLLDIGRAVLEPLGPPGLAGGAVLGTAATTSGLRFRNAGEDVAIDVVLTGAGYLASLFATTDLGDEHVLLEPRVMAPGTHMEVARWTPERDEGRVTFWLVLASVATDPAAMRDLAGVNAAAAEGGVEIIAARWTEPDP